MSSKIFESSTCTLCMKICLGDSIYCQLCNTWFHPKCLKITKKQFISLGQSDLPFYCPPCVSKILPFSTITNYQFNNSVVSNHNQNSKRCINCIKPINKFNSSYCISGKHFFHINCSEPSISKTSVWCCSYCLNLPFFNIKDNELTNETLTSETRHKHNFRVNLNQSLTSFNRELPQLVIPNPADEDYSPIDFKYYNFKESHELFSKPNHDTFSVIHTNIRSYNKNFAEFNAMLNSFRNDFDVIGLTETWDSTTAPLNLEEVDQYHPIEKANGDTQNAGAALYVKKSLNYIRRDDITGKCNLAHTESLFVDIDSEKQNILVGVLYRHPNKKIHEFIDSLKELLSELSKEKKAIIIMGDFNINLLNINQHKDSSRFLDTMLDRNLIPYITQPTRFDKDNKGTLIDNIFFNDCDTECVSGNIMSHISDHLPNFLLVPLEKKKKINYKQRGSKRDFSKFDLTSFKSDYETMKLEQKLERFCDPNDMYNFFHNGISLLFEMHCPLKKISKKDYKKQQKPWVDDIIISNIKKRDNIYSEYLQTGDTDKLHQSSILRNEINHSIRRNKYLYQKHKLNALKNNAKKLWKEMNRIVGKKSNNNIPSTMFKNKKKITGTKNIADNFNSHYSGVAENLLKNINTGKDPLKTLNSRAHSFFFNPTNNFEVSDMIRGLDVNKASDIYNFPIAVIQKLSDTISPALSHIFNSSIKKGIFPEKLKVAKVVPLFKSGAKTEFINYRPVSILPIFDKIFEKIIHKRIMSYIDTFKILNENQFGFQGKKSTSHAILKLANDIGTAIKGNNYCCTIFLDLAKAFDTVNHNILLAKLEKLGIRGPMLKWFKSYLKSRYQHVYINGTLSDPVMMQHGVPQGSVLGPLLFHK